MELLFLGSLAPFCNPQSPAWNQELGQGPGQCWLRHSQWPDTPSSLAVQEVLGSRESTWFPGRPVTPRSPREGPQHQSGGHNQAVFSLFSE